MSSTYPQELLDPIAQGVRDWLSICATAGEDKLERAPAGEWSIKQHTFHVADGMDATRERIASMLADQTPDLLAFDADEWASERRYGERGWAEARRALESQWELLRAACGDLSGAELARSGRHAKICEILGLEGDALTVADLLRFEAQHMDEHLHSVRALAGADGELRAVP